MTLKIYVSPSGRLIREDLGKPAEVALADVFRHTLTTQERTDALAGVYGDDVKVRVLEIEADTPAGTGTTIAAITAATSAGTSAERTALRAAGFFQGIAGTLSSEAQMLGITAPLNPLDTVNRSDTNTVWRYLGGAKTVLANWRNEGAGGAGTFAALTDKATADLPAINQPLAAALGARALAASATVLATGVTTLTGVPSAGAPTGHFNRPLGSDHDLAVDSASANNLDAILVWNSHPTNVIKITAGSLEVFVAPATWGTLTYKDTVWTDDNAMARPGSRSYYPVSLATVPVSTTGVAATVRIPANVFGPKSLARILFQAEAVGTTDNILIAVKVGPANVSVGSSLETNFAVMVAANAYHPAEVILRGNGTTSAELITQQNNSLVPLNPSAASTLRSVAVNTAQAWDVQIVLTTSTTDTAKTSYCIVEIINPGV